MGSFKPKLIQFGVAKEVTAGTPVSPVFDKVVIADSVTMTTNFDINEEVEKYADGTAGNSPTTYGTKSVTLNFSAYWFPNSTPASAPEMEIYLSAAGFTGAAITTVGYKLEDKADALQNTLTFAVVHKSTSTAAKQFIISGAACSGCVINADIGKAVKVDYTYEGVFNLPTDIAAPAVTANTTQQPLTFKNVPVTIGGVSKCVKSFSLDLGLSANPYVCSNATDGISHFETSAEKAPVISLDVIEGTVASDDVFKRAYDEDVEEIEMVFNTDDLTITLPQCQQRAPEEANADGYHRYNLAYAILKNGTANADVDDESSIYFLQGATS